MQNSITQEIYKRKITETILDEQCNTRFFHYIFVDKDIMQNQPVRRILQFMKIKFW